MFNIIAMKGPSIALLLVLFAVALKVNAGTFCSAYCNDCNDIGPTNCTSCPTNFVAALPACNINSSYYTVVLETKNSSTTFDDSKNQNCGVFNGIPGIYSTSNNPSMILYNTATIAPHYMLRIRLFLLWIDYWSATSTAVIDVDGAAQMTATYSQATLGAKECKTPAQEQSSYVFDSGDFTHTATSLNLKITVDGCPSNPCNWAVKQIIVLAVPCHSYCAVCTGSANTQCSACVSPYLLASTTCDTTCPTLYFQSTTTTCAQCNTNCTACANNANNCSACMSGFYLYETTCVNPCPGGTFVNGSICSNCTTGCAGCTGSPTPCQSCSAGYYLYNTGCTNNCPTGTWANTATKTCDTCDTACTACSGSGTNCSACVTASVLFSSNYSCISSCPDGWWEDPTPNKCLQCDGSCAICTNTPTPCTACNSGYFLSGTACITNCPGGTFGNTATKTCDTCDTACTACSGSGTNCSACVTAYVLFSSNYSCIAYCPNGWWQDTTPNKCLQCDGSCAICTNTPTPCSACNTGYFLSGTACITNCPGGTFGNTVTNTCDTCDPACTACNGTSTNCTACVTTSVLFSSNYSCIASCPNGWWQDTTPNQCFQCDGSCAICTNTPTPCSACNSGYFLSGTACITNCPGGTFGNTVAKTCDTCDAACTACSGSGTNCSACVTASVLFSSNNSCIPSCPNGWWEDPTPNQCFQCDTSCAICTNTPTPCSACNTGYFLSGTACVTTCPGNTFGNTVANICDTCNSACTVCNGTSTNCTACGTASVLFASNYSCLASCPNGWWKNPTPNQCFQCDTSCAVCTGSPTPCTVCNTSFFLSGVACVSSCPTGQYGDVPTLTCKTCDTACTICANTATNCSACVTAFVLFSSNYSCLPFCPSGWWENSTQNQCFQCDTSCAICTGSPTPCTACSTGYFLSGTACVTNCPGGTFANTATKTCDPCNSVCTLCANTATNCSACISTYYLIASNYTCVPACPTTLYYTQNTPTKQCIPCDAGCSVCSGPSSNCSVCLATYYYYAGNNLCTLTCPALTTPVTGWICIDCDPTCLVCTNTAVNCSSCVAASVLFQSNNTCISSCPDSYFENSSNICQGCDTICSTCTGFPTPCTSCKVGYFLLNNNSCVTTCPPGTYPNVTARNCDPCHTNCTICTSSTTTCTVCATGFYLYKPGWSCASTCPGGYFSDTSTGTGLCLTYFCSSYCTPKNCTGIAHNQCKMECPWAYNSSSLGSGVCTLDMNRYQILMEAGNGTANSNTSSVADCGAYTALPGFFGPSTSVLIFNDTILQNHFKIRIRAAVIFIDDWNSNSRIAIYLDGSDVAGANYGSVFNIQQECNQPTPERGAPVDVEANHANPTAIITLRSSTCANTSNCLWMYREAVVAIIVCHSYCISCYGTGSNNCNSCANLTAGKYLLSNNTCALTCHSQAYQTGPNSCTFCAWNCTRCAGSPTNCSVCRNNSGYVYLPDNNSCPTSCPPKYFNDTNICRACDTYCASCSGVPSPCQTCVSGAYSYNHYCYGTCPSPLYDDNYTMTCLTFQQYYVFLTIGLTFERGDLLNIDMAFSQPIDWSTFNYTSFQSFTFSSYPKIKQGNFQFTYSELNSSAYRISLLIKDFTFLHNELLTMVTNNSAIPYFSAYGRPFYMNNYEKVASTHWTYIKITNMSQSQENLASTFTSVSTQINDVTSGQFVQDAKKSGVAMLVANSLQITSCILLINTVLPRNLYEGIRLFASLIFFDVPPYQAQSTKEKYFVVPSVDQLTTEATNRRLLAMSQTNFRRSGFTSYFLFDAYPQVFIICFLWLLMIPVYFLRKKKYGQRIYGYLHSLIHKFNDIAILYFTLTLLFEFYYFTQSPIRITSLILCIICNLYLFLYGLYRYYDLISYPYAEIGTPEYERFALLYGGFLKNIRYVKYRPRKPREWLWDWKQPSSYHIVSYVKKVLMMFGLAIFYSRPEWQISTLIAIQIGEAIRFWIVWPFRSKFYNIFRFSLQIVLLTLFCCVGATIGSLNQILSHPIEQATPYVSTFFLVGWVALACVLLYNGCFLLIFIYDFIQGCRFTNREMMDATRKEYYESLLSKYEKANEEVPTRLLKDWAMKGLVDQKKQRERPTALVLCETYEISLDEDCFIVYIDKAVDFVKKKSFKLVNNSVFIEVGKSIQHERTVDQADELYPYMQKIFEQYADVDTTKIIFKTLVELDQSDGKPGDTVPIKAGAAVEHDVTIESGGHSRNLCVTEGLEGFPIPSSLFIKLYCM